MKDIKTILRIVIPSILCAGTLIMTKMPIEYYPLSFGLILGVFNWEYHKTPPIVGVLLSVSVSYASFFIAYFSLGGFAYILDVMLKNQMSSDSMGLITFMIGPFIVAPILVFFSYRFVFKISWSKSSIVLMVFSIVLLVLLNYIMYSNEITLKVLTPYILWQIVMALALQILINREVILKKHH